MNDKIITLKDVITIMVSMDQYLSQMLNQLIYINTKVDSIEKDVVRIERNINTYLGGFSK